MVEVTSARVVVDDRVAATIDRIDVGGGSQTVTVDGAPEERVHPRSIVYHVRLLSPDRMIPDQLREVPAYEDAVQLALTYAAKVAEHADRIAEIAEDLRV